MHLQISPIHAVLFDYGLVLSSPPDPAAWERLKRIFAVDEQEFHAAYWKFRSDYDRGSLTAAAYWNEVSRTLHSTFPKPLPSAQLHELIDADTALWTAPNQPMIDWAVRLQRAGIKTGILSNIGDAMEQGVLAHCPWLADFAHHTFSHRLGIAKPDAAIYRHAAAGLAEPPANILFLDDREENIAAARAAGMQAIQYSGHDSFLASLQAAGLGWLLNPPPQAAAEQNAQVHPHDQRAKT